MISKNHGGNWRAAASLSSTSARRKGIGAIYAKALAAAGARLNLCDLQAPDAATAAIRDAGGEAISVVCDVTDAAAVARLVAAMEAAFGGVQGAVNNAALFATLPRIPLQDITSNAFDKVMQVNVRGSFECIKAVLPAMRRHGYGKIVNIASGTVFKGAPMVPSYVTSKGATVAMTRCVAREIGGDGITVHCLAPA